MSGARKHFSEREIVEASRENSRTFGCFGVSFVAHAALLAALAIIPLSFHDIGGDDAGASASGAVSLVDSEGGSEPNSSAMEATSNDLTNAQSLEGDINSVATVATQAIAETVAAPTDVASSTLTDPASEIVTVKPRTKIVTPVADTAAPATASAPKKSAAPKAVMQKPKNAPTKTIETVDAAKNETPIETPAEVSNEPAEENLAPVLLANPPSDDEKPEPVEQEPTPVGDTEKSEAPVARMAPAPEAETESQPEMASDSKPVTTPAANSKSSQDSQTESKSESDTKPGVAAAKATGDAPTSDSSNPSGERTSESNSNSGNGGHDGSARSGNTNSGGEEDSGESSGSVAGPVRDASDLKALPGNPNPSYPARDRLAKREGTAVILGRVSPDGRISEVTVERSSGSPQMDAASVQAFRSWKFQAGQQGWVRKPFQFRLVGEAKEVPAPLGKTLQR